MEELHGELDLSFDSGSEVNLQLLYYLYDYNKTEILKTQMTFKGSNMLSAQR